MAEFPGKPTLSIGESPSLYSNTPEDNSIKADTDGGYEFRRTRFTRPRRRQIQTGFIGLSAADYAVLSAFEETHTNVVAFTYFDYIRNQTYQVRIDEWKPTYTGVGKTVLWNLTIKMSEV